MKSCQKMTVCRPYAGTIYVDLCTKF